MGSPLGNQRCPTVQTLHVHESTSRQNLASCGRKTSGTTASYAIAERTFELPPRYARTHVSCQVPTIEFQMPDEEGGPKTVQPSGGDRFVLVEEGEGYTVQEEDPEQETPQQ
jgi:hypothetical protein